MECLPAIVKECLLSVVREKGFTAEGDYVLKQAVHGDISSSCQVHVNEDNERLILFVKYFIPPQSKKSEGLLYYNNETVFYGELLPLFKDIDNKDGNICHFTPNCLYVHNKQSFILIMEDLASQGYQPFNIKEPLGLETARYVVAHLGKFHAFSFAAKDQRPQEFRQATSKLSETVFKSDGGQDEMAKIFIRSIHDAFKLTKQSLPVDSIYVEKFAAFTLNVYDRISFLINGELDNDEYKVLTHGDLWLNNILSRQDTAEEVVKFVDFQGCRLASPVHDLMFVLLVGLDKLTRDLHREELIRHYHTSLCTTLQYLGSDPLRLFPCSALQREIHKHTQLVLSLALTGLPLHLHEQDAPSTTNEPNEQGGNVEKLFHFLIHNKSMKCKNKMLEIIMDCVDHGYI